MKIIILLKRQLLTIISCPKWSRKYRAKVCFSVGTIKLEPADSQDGFFGLQRQIQEVFTNHDLCPGTR